MIVATEDTLALWYGRVDENCDFLAHLAKKGEKGYVVLYRFRYYKDDKVGFESRDEKHWYRLDIKEGGTPEEEIKLMTEAWRAMMSFTRWGEEGLATFVRKEGESIDDMLERVTQHPAVYTKTIYLH